MAQLRPEVLPPAAFPHGHGARRAAACSVCSVWGVLAAPSSPQGPFVSLREVLVTALRLPPTPLGNLRPHLPPQIQTTSSRRAKRYHWDGGSGGSGDVRLLGGTRVGDVPTVSDSPYPLHHPSTLVTASTELPKTPETASLGTRWEHSMGQRTLPALSPGVAGPKVWGHRAKMWVPRAVMGTRQWPCCPSGSPTKALPLGSMRALPAQGCTHLGTRWLPTGGRAGWHAPGATGCEVARGQRGSPPWDAPAPPGPG